MKLKLEVVMFDDGTPLSRYDAPSSCYVGGPSSSQHAAGGDGWKGVVEAHRALGAALAQKARVIESTWNTYGGGGDEEVALRSSVRTLWAWAGRATPTPGLSSMHSLRRPTLALASLKLRLPLRDAGALLERSLRAVTKTMVEAVSARATSSVAQGVHAASRPRLARRYETLLEALRDAYREVRVAWVAFVDVENAVGAPLTSGAAVPAFSSSSAVATASSPNSGVDKALESCVGACGAALALARQIRAEQEAGKAFARGRVRDGAGALASGWASERAQSARYMELINGGLAGPSIPFATALENAKYLSGWKAKEASLMTANSALQAQLDAVTAEKERIAEQWARTTDLLRQQRAQLSKLALEGHVGNRDGVAASVESGPAGASTTDDGVEGIDA